MNKIKSIIDEIAQTDITVLIKGESGTGKELLAHIIHSNSNRNHKPLVKVNCAAIPNGLLESELFGYEKGAFTGAHIKKPGKFELANNGTILLNDIGEMDISTQAKLLEVLQDGMFFRLGGEGEVIVNTRVIATTKDHLERSMREGHFREDLFFRINVINITVPPLRDRRDQILPLSLYYFDFYKKKYQRDVPPFSTRVVQALRDYHWPGNIRELENVVKRIVLFGKEEMILETLERPKLDQSIQGAPIPPENFNLKGVGRKAAEEAEKRLIEDTLQKTHWNRKKAAQLLRVSYKALLYKIQKYRLDGLEKDPWGREEVHLKSNKGIDQNIEI